MGQQFLSTLRTELEGRGLDGSLADGCGDGFAHEVKGQAEPVPQPGQIGVFGDDFAQGGGFLGA